MNTPTLVAPPPRTGAIHQDGNPKLALATLPSHRAPSSAIRLSNATTFLVVTLVLFVATIVALELGP